MTYQPRDRERQSMGREYKQMPRPLPLPQVYAPPGYPRPYPVPPMSQTWVDRLLNTKVRKKLMTLIVSGLILFLNDIFELGIERSTIAYFVGIAATFILGQGIADMGKERAVIQAQSGVADNVSYDVEVEGGASANFAAGGGNSERPTVLPRGVRNQQVPHG